MSEIVKEQSSSSANSLLAGGDGMILFELVVSSSVKDSVLRGKLRTAFGEKIEMLSGISVSGSSHDKKKLATYMHTDIVKNDVMPSHVDDMHARLKSGYMAKLAAWCKSETYENPDVPLKNLKPMPLGGLDSYCIGKDGQYFCYHYFALMEQTDASEPWTKVTVTVDEIVGTVALVCVGKS